MEFVKGTPLKKIEFYNDAPGPWERFVVISSPILYLDFVDI